MTLGEGLEKVIELGRRYQLRTAGDLIEHCTDAILQYAMMGSHPEVSGKEADSLNHIRFYINVIRYLHGLGGYDDENKAEVERFLGALF